MTKQYPTRAIIVRRYFICRSTCRMCYHCTEDCFFTKTTKVIEVTPFHYVEVSRLLFDQCRIDLYLTDPSDSIVATAFDGLAEQILGHDARSLRNMDTKTLKKLVSSLDGKYFGKKFYANIRTLKKKYEDKKTRYSIQELQEMKCDDQLQGLNKYQVFGTASGERYHDAESTSGSIPESSSSNIPEMKQKMVENNDGARPEKGAKNA